MISPAVSRAAARWIHDMQPGPLVRLAIMDATTDEELTQIIGNAIADDHVLAGGAEWETNPELVAAGWDESKIRRYPRGTRVAGPAGGGWFAPKGEAAVTNEAPVSPVAMGEVAPAGTPLAALVEGNRFWLGGKQYQVIRWDGDNLVVEMAGEGVERTLPKPSGMTGPSPSEAPRIEVTGRSLKPGSRFWIRDRYDNVTEYVVPTEGPGAERNASGLSRYVMVEEAETGKRHMLKRSVKVLVHPDDFPAAAKRQASVPVSHVTGPYGQIFERTPGKTNMITLAANRASAETEALGITLPAELPKIPLKETRSLAMGGIFRGRQRPGETTITPDSIAIRKSTPEFTTTTEAMTDVVHHEVGHYLDTVLAGSARNDRGFGGYASVVRDPNVAGPVMDAIDASDAWQRLEDMDRSSDYVIQTSNNEWPIDRGHVRYLRDPTERFARAWEQYVATRVTERNGQTEFSPRMFRYRKGAAAPTTVKKLIGQSSPVVPPDATTESDSFYGWYWTAEDFAPIADEIDAMLGRVGWSKP